MKKIVFLLSLCICGITTYAQNEVSLVVSADGATKTQAIDNALRSAIEQTYGTFVSAKTQILNDELVKDEIATVSSGNIQKYSEIAAVTLPNGNTSVTLNVTVSLAKLISYAQSKGSECEFLGSSFAANKRLYDFNKKNEEIAIQNLLKQLDAMRPIYDYRINISEPKMSGVDNAQIKYEVRAFANERTKQFNELLEQTLKSIGKSEQDIKTLITSGFAFTPYYISTNGKFQQKKKNLYYFYNRMPNELDLLLNEVLFDFIITDNENNNYSYYLSLENTIEQIAKNKQIDPHVDIKGSAKWQLALLIPATIFVAATWICPEKIGVSIKTARLWYTILFGVADTYVLAENLKGSKTSKVTINRSGVIAVDGNNVIVINPNKKIWEISSATHFPVEIVAKINKIYVKPQKKKSPKDRFLDNIPTTDIEMGEDNKFHFKMNMSTTPPTPIKDIR